MVIGVCASYDIFVNWDQLWTAIFSKFRSDKGRPKQTLNTHAVLVESSNEKPRASVSTASQQVSQASLTSKNGSTVNGMTSRSVPNGGSKVKSAELSRNQKRGVKKECDEESGSTSTVILTAVIIRIGLIK